MQSSVNSSIDNIYIGKINAEFAWQSVPIYNCNQSQFQICIATIVDWK